MSGYNPHTAQDIAAMLAAIGVGSIDDLFAHVPANLRARAAIAHQPRSTAIMVRRSRMYRRVPTRTGGVQDRFVSSEVCAEILNASGEGCAIIRLPS